jgi:hypothetical protein
MAEIKSFVRLLEERPRIPFNETNLPDLELLPRKPNVTLTREAVAQFRNDYVILLQFVAVVLDKPFNQIGPLDCMKWLVEQEAKDGKKRKGR